MFPKTVAAMTFDYLAREELADKKAARLDPRFDATTLPQYSGRYRVTAPEVMLAMEGGGLSLLAPRVE